jgi:hypothetical protein
MMGCGCVAADDVVTLAFWRRILQRSMAEFETEISAFWMATGGAAPRCSTA